MNVRKLVIHKYKDGQMARVEDDMAVEAPMDILVGDTLLMTAMRLPDEDLHLAAGILYSEGVIDSRADLLSLEKLPDRDAAMAILTPEAEERFQTRRPGPQPILSGTEPFFDPKPRTTRTELPMEELLRLKNVFEERKDIHPLTGATHSALLFDRSLEIIAYAEDIGRHNALDKCIGSLVLAGRREEAFLCIMSSRQSYEIVAKAGRLGVEFQIGVSTVTSLAADLARNMGITLVGFFRKGRMNIYTHPERLRFP